MNIKESASQYSQISLQALLGVQGGPVKYRQLCQSQREALNKAMETPEITDLTFQRPTGPGSRQEGHQASCLSPCT